MKRLLRSLSVALLVLWGCGGRNQGDREKPAAAPPASAAAIPRKLPENLLRIDPEMLRDLRVTVEEVEERPGGEGVVALGELRVNEDAYAEIGSPVPARVLSVHAAPGDPAKAGQRLARLQSQELGKAWAELLSARARAELAAGALERKRPLASKGVIAGRELQEAEAASLAANADQTAAEAALRAVGVDADQMEDAGNPSIFLLRAPIAGTVIERTAVRGQLADPARPLFKVADLSRLWLTVQAFERDAVRVRVGAPARVTLAALPGREFRGEVIRLGRQVESSSRTIPVRIDLENPGDLLRPGMSATAWLPLGKETATVLAVPAASLQRIGGRWCVFLPREEGTFEIRAVGRGRELGGEVEIVSGLRRGEKVVAEGAFLLKAESEKSRGEGEHHDH